MNEEFDLREQGVWLEIIQQDDGWLCREDDFKHGDHYRTLYKTKDEAINYLKETYFENVVTLHTEN